MMENMTKQRPLGFWIVTSLVLGNMIGSGIYLLPAALASIGTISLWSWVCTGVGGIFLALVFSRLSIQYPLTGGPYVYCRKGFGDFIGFQVAYNYWIYLGVGIAAIAIAFSGYLSAFIPMMRDDPRLSTFAALIVVWSIILINTVGVLFAGWFQLIMTVLKIIPLLVLIAVGVFSVDTTYLAEFNVSGESNFGALSTGVLLTLWAFLGLESACIPAEEVHNPKKTIPLATILGTLIATAIYIAATFVIMGVIPLTILEKSPAPFAELATFLFGPWGQALVSIGAMISCIGTLNGWVLTQSRIGFAAARDNLFPAVFGKQSRFNTPMQGLLITGLTVTALLFATINETIVDSFTHIVTMATFAAVLSYLYTAIADIILIKKEEQTPKWSSTFIAIAAFVYVFWSITSVDSTTAYLGTLLLALSVPAYALIRVTRPSEST